MLPEVTTHTYKLEDYKAYIPESQFQEIQKLAYSLKGLKVNMINSTPRGGGVAEILKSLVPLMKGLGIQAKWYTIPPRDDFFKITKEMHNALQGKNYDFPFSHRARYLKHMERSAKQMRDMRADLWVIHDPQPAGVMQYLPQIRNSVCRIHIDLTSPNMDVWKFIASFLEMYKKIVVSSKEFVKPEFREKAVVIPPAIDPLNPKNEPSDFRYSKELLKSYGIAPEKPLISQVSRFDPWKDPLGVIKAYRIAKEKIPDLQLALVGFFMASDDPEAIKVFKKVKKETEKDPDVFLFSDLSRLGSLKINTFVNAIQTSSDVLFQKSIREGFALTVTEAMWKKKAIIGGNAGGIKVQIEDGKNGFLVKTPEEAAKRTVQLIKNPALARELGEKAHKTVQEKFLMPRLLRDYLCLFKKTLLCKNRGGKANKEINEILTSYRK